MMDSTLLSVLNRARLGREAVTVVTDLASGDKRFVDNTSLETDPLRDAIKSRLKSAKSGIEPTSSGEQFIQVYVPSPRLVVIGAVHISQALVPMAQACDFDVTVIDPRTAFSSPDRFPNVTLHADWPEQVLTEPPLDPFTAMVAITHDPKIDDYPLKTALETRCFYVGALGSRKTHAKRVTRLLEAGVDQSAIDLIHAPIGQDIRAATPAEIAIAIMAQVIEVLRKGNNG